MEGPLSFLQFNPACLLILVFGVSLLDYVVSNWSPEQKEAITFIPRPSTNTLARRHISSKQRTENETPLGRNCGLRRHRIEVLAGVKRRLDQHF